MNGLLAPASPGLIAFCSFLSFCFAIFFLIRRLSTTVGLRDLRLAGRFLAERNHAKAKFHATRFLALIRNRPWLKRILWFFSRNPHDPEARALNCLGAAETHFKDFEAAREHLQRAIKLAPKFSYPYHNMGYVLLNTGTRLQAKSFFDQAIKLGHPTDKKTFAVMSGPVGFDESNGSSLTMPTETYPAAEPRYEVRMLNDDKTHMNFVVTILEQVFNKTYVESAAIMLAIHKAGYGTCGVYPRAEAVAKVFEVERRAREFGHPLVCQVVPEQPA